MISSLSRFGGQDWRGHRECNETQRYCDFGETRFVQIDLRYQVRPLRKLNVKLQHVLLPDWNRILLPVETFVYCKLEVEGRCDIWEFIFGGGVVSRQEMQIIEDTSGSQGPTSMYLLSTFLTPSSSSHTSPHDMVKIKHTWFLFPGDTVPA